MVLQHSYDMFSRQVEVCVQDNLLLVHQLDSSTVMLLDVRARTNGPIAGPLPLAVAQPQSLPQAQAQEDKVAETADSC